MSAETNAPQGTDLQPKQARARVFPLRLVPIDDFFLLDDRPEYPMTFTSHLRLSGEVHRDAFEKALQVALNGHPILTAVVKPIKANQPCWTTGDDVQPAVWWGQLGDPWQLPQDREAIDLKREAGLRIWVHNGAGQAEILLQFHHACCDGTGAYRFIGDLLAEYGVLTASSAASRPQPEACDLALLRARRMKMASTALLGSLPSLLRRGLGHSAELFGRRVAPLATGRPTYRHGDGAPPFPGVVTLTFNREEHLRLRSAASDAGVMPNDLLLAGMFLAMWRWNQAQGVRRHERLRIMMPTDLREKEDILMPAANMTSYSFLTRDSRECGDGEALLKGVRDETARIKYEKRGKRFIDAVMMANRIPGLLPFLLNRKRCLASVILSNVGDPTRRFLSRFPREAGRVVAGNVCLEGISGVPPLRPQSRATVSIVTYRRDLAINLRCDPSALSEEDTQRFLAIYGQELRAHLS